MTKGCIYWDESSRGYNCSNSGKPKKRGRWVGERNINGKRVRMRSTDFNKVMAWMCLDPSFSPEDITKGKGSTLQITRNEEKKSRNEEKKCSSIVTPKEKNKKETATVTDTPVVNKRTFTPLIGLPGYYADLNTGEIWSNKKRIPTQKAAPKWHKLTLRAYRGFNKVSVNVDGKSRELSTDKLLYAAENKLNYYDIPSSWKHSQPEDEKKLIPLEEFPNYYYDKERNQIWSLFSYRNGIPSWKLLKTYESRDGSDVYSTLILFSNSKRRAILVYYRPLAKSLEKGVSYFNAAIADVENDNLIRLRDFPTYYIDIETGDIYHYSNFRSRTKRYRKINPDSKNNKYIYLGKNHVCIPKLLFAVQHKISYFDIPKDNYVFVFNIEQAQKGKKKKIDVLSRGDAKMAFVRNKQASEHNNRLENLERAIKELRFLRKAYMGDIKPLIEYVHENRDRLLGSIAKRAAISEERAKIGYELAYDAMLNKIDFTTSTIYNFSLWFVNRAFFEYRKYIYSAQHKFIDIDTIPMYSDKKIVRK